MMETSGNVIEGIVWRQFHAAGSKKRHFPPDRLATDCGKAAARMARATRPECTRVITRHRAS